MLRLTQILSMCGLREWPECVSAEMREFAMNRGTMIHRATALFDAGTLDWSSLDPRIAGFVRAYEKFRTEVGGKIEAIEHEVVSRRYGYAGRLDRVFGRSAVCAGRMVVDIKTNAADAATRLQTSGYALAYGRTARRGYVSLFEDGKYKCEAYPARDDAADRVAWLACVALAKWKQRRGIKETQ